MNRREFLSSALLTGSALAGDRQFNTFCEGVFGVAGSPADTPDSATPCIVTPKEMAATPISALLYGNFIELGFGMQVEAMWGEMFFNRSFEQFSPYADHSIGYQDLYFDRKDRKKGYKTDWTKEDWYHSGYQHNAWFAAPGEEGPFHIDDKSTFIIQKSPVLDVEIRQVIEDVRHGKLALEIINRERGKWGALAQQGKYLRKGEIYRFSGLIKVAKGRIDAEVRFYPQGSWDKPIVRIPIRGITAEYQEKRFSFKNDALDGWATFSLWIPPKSSVTVDDFSLMPASAVHGWRREVVDIVGRVNPKIIRFPGGCFASFYDWRIGVGPRQQRKPEPSYAWGGLNYNDVGTAELAMLARQVGAEMMFVVNLFHPKKQKYMALSPDENLPHGFDLLQFTDLQQGAKLAADWVAYCNRPAGTHPMADLRAKHGYHDPFNVRFWELDNEAYSWFTPEEYASAAVVYAKAMKTVDPGIKIGLEIYGRLFAQSHRKIIDIAGRYVDFVADRRDAEAGLDTVLQVVRDYNAQHGTELGYCNTEKQFTENPLLDAENAREYNGPITRSLVQSRWYYAMNVLRQYMSFQRRGGAVTFVNFNNLANTHSQCVMDTPKEGAFLTASGRALELLSRSPASWPLQLEGYSASVKDEFQVQAAWDRERKRLVLYVFNRTREPREVVFDLSQLPREFQRAEISMLSADTLMVKNTLKQPDAIRRKDTVETMGRGQHCRVAVPKYSFTQVVLN